MKRGFLFLILTTALVFLTGLASAQSRMTGAIEGRVLDDQGAALPGVEVKIASPGLIGGSQSRTTDTNGKFRFVLLPSGIYTIEASLTGFIPAKNENVRIFVGQTITIDLTLKIGTLQQEITVTGTAPLVDVKDSQTLTTNLDREMIESVGATRSKNSTGLINLAPGTANSSVMGAPSRVSNAWQLDGMNLAWLAYGADGNYPDLTILEEVQVSGIGANAEYGNFTGAAMNLITKSGGNVLEGLAEVSYSPLNWIEKNFDPNEPKFSLFKQPSRKLFFDAHVGIGGAFIKDKLWFYFSGGTVQNDTEIIGFSERESMKMPSVFLKLTFQPDQNNRLQAFFQYEHFTVNNRDLSPVRPLETTYYDWGPDFPINLSYFHTFTDKTFLEVSAGYWNLRYDQRPNSGKDVPERRDFRTGMYSGNNGWWGEENTEHITINAKISHHAENFIAGSHDLKLGVEFLSGYEKFIGGYPGGFKYVDNVPGYDYQYHTYAYAFTYNTYAKALKFTGFAQDSWKISDRLTINPGIRISSFKGTLPNVPDLTFKPKLAFEPRIGLTWDVFGDHTTAVKAHYGRYIDSIKTALYQAADNANGDWVMYDVLPNGTKIEIYRQSFSKPKEIDPDIRMPSADQFTLGFERTLMKDMAVGATFVYREFNNFIAMVNTTATWREIPYTFKDDTGALQTINVYTKTSPSSADKFMITNPKAGMSDSVITTPKNKFTGVTLFFEKRFSNNWMLHTAYTYGVAKGNFANNFSGGAGLLTDFQNPNLQINAEGRLPNDPTHNLQIYGTIILPLDFSLSPRISVFSGNPWTRDYRVPVSGSPRVRFEPRGVNRFPTRADLDFRLEKNFRLKEKMRIGLILDVFNILNQGVERDIYTQVGTSYFGKASTVTDARYFRVSARFFF
jgi:hypothetical protein